VCLALGHVGEEGRLHVGGLVHPGGDAVGEQFEQEVLLAGGRVLEEFHQLGHLPSVQGQGREALAGAFFDVLAIGFEHDLPLARRERGCILRDIAPSGKIPRWCIIPAFSAGANPWT